MSARVVPHLFLQGRLPLTLLLDFAHLICLPLLHGFLVLGFCDEAEYLIQSLGFILTQVLFCHLLVIVLANLIFVLGHILIENSQVLYSRLRLDMITSACFYSSYATLAANACPYSLSMYLMSSFY
jgi:hypothetical protein